MVYYTPFFAQTDEWFVILQKYESPKDQIGTAYNLCFYR